jgi:hypothetical protein
MADRNGKAVWQVGGGPTQRSYVDQFIEFGVALIGSADAGEWNSGLSDDDFGGSGVRRFATEPRLGDVVLLRSGQSTIHAVGLIASEYMYLQQFDDVNGWDLQHARRVRWYRLPGSYNFGAAVFGANPRRFSRINVDSVIGYAQRFIQSPPMDWQTATLPSLPDPEPELASIPEPLSEVVALAADLGRQYWDREQFGDRPSEDEMIAHYVIPLLRAMGWPPENIAVQWWSIDVCVFVAVPRVPENIKFVIEAKRLGDGVEGALAQAQGYASGFGVTCDLIVTDGLRYRLYDGSSGFRPAGYANLIWLKQSSEKLFARIKRV